MMINKKKMSAAEFIKYAAENHVKFELPENNKKYPSQVCQDDELTKSFRKLHVDVVNMIISWCKAHNVTIDELHLNADGLRDSIPTGEWQSCTDSSLSFYNEQGVTTYHHDPFLFSM